MRLAMVGPASSILGFRSLGLDTFEVRRPTEAREVWRSIEADRYAVIFITEDVAELITEELEMFRQLPLPVITLIPPVSGGQGTGVQRLKALVETAIGTDVLGAGNTIKDAE
jgi:V/A-type H+-transporting ATPase subunit F